MTKVELREGNALAKTGKVAIYKGQADKEGVAFFLDGIGIGTPVAVFLIAGKGPLTLHVKNDMSNKWDRNVEPDKGIAETRFRTEGAATMLVTSNGPLTNYELVIWVGPEIKLHKLQQPPFVTKAAYEKKHAGVGGGGSPGGTIIALAVVALVVVGGVMVVRRKMKKGGAA